MRRPEVRAARVGGSVSERGACGGPAGAAAIRLVAVGAGAVGATDAAAAGGRRLGREAARSTTGSPSMVMTSPWPNSPGATVKTDPPSATIRVSIRAGSAASGVLRPGVEFSALLRSGLGLDVAVTLFGSGGGGAKVRLRRIGFCRLAPAFRLGNHAPDGGEDFLHRGLGRRQLSRRPGGLLMARTPTKPGPEPGELNIA